MTEDKKNRKIENDNPAEWLKSFKGCEHYSDEEAIAVVESLDALATILLENAAQKLRSNNRTIYISREEQTQRRAA